MLIYLNWYFDTKLSGCLLLVFVAVAIAVAVVVADDEDVVAENPFPNVLSKKMFDNFVKQDMGQKEQQDGDFSN